MKTINRVILTKKAEGNLQKIPSFYIEKNDGVIELIEVLEINKHDY